MNKISSSPTKNSFLVGPFFYYKGKILAHKILVLDAEKRGDKFDNPFSHEQLFESISKTVDYIDVPRGRVIWDSTNNHAIMYVDVCIEKKAGLIEKIAREFCLDTYTIEYDLHYRCKLCLKNLKI